MTEDNIIISITMWWSYVGLCNVNSPDNYISNNQSHLNKWQKTTELQVMSLDRDNNVLELIRFL